MERDIRHTDIPCGVLGEDDNPVPSLFQFQILSIEFQMPFVVRVRICNVHGFISISVEQGFHHDNTAAVLCRTLYDHIFPCRKNRVVQRGRDLKYRFDIFEKRYDHGCGGSVGTAVPYLYLDQICARKGTGRVPCVVPHRSIQGSCDVLGGTVLYQHIEGRYKHVVRSSSLELDEIANFHVRVVTRGGYCDLGRQGIHERNVDPDYVLTRGIRCPYLDIVDSQFSVLCIPFVFPH